MEAKYTDYFDEDLNKDVLVKDLDFISDASQFLAGRTGEVPQTDEEVYDKFMEHMRFHETNEVTAVRDLMYAQEADDEQKQQFGRLLETWDRMEGDPMSWQKAGDYLEAGITSPSTWIGLVTGGAGKAASMAGLQAAKIGARTIIKEALKGAGKSALVEGAIGLGAGAAQEGARVETGAQEEFTGGRTVATGVGQALAGSLPGVISGGFQARQTAKAMGLREAGEEAMSVATEKAKKKVTTVLAKVKDKKQITKTQADLLGDEVIKAREFLKKYELDELPKDQVKEGTILLSKLTDSEKTIASLDDSLVESITAASIELGKKIKLKKGERITSGVSRALDEGKITTDELTDFLKEFDLTKKDFSLMYMAEFSRAGRTLAQASKIKRGVFGSQQVEETAQRQLDELSGAVQKFLDMPDSGLTRDELLDIARQGASLTKEQSFMQNLDRFRLSMMTGQLATTVRNFAGGGFRVAADVADTGFKNILKGNVPFISKSAEYESPASIAKYLLTHQAEAKIIRDLFTKNNPAEADKFFGTFMETATASAKLGADTRLGRIGAGINFANRWSDNVYKQATFAGSLDRAVRKTMKKADGKPMSLSDVIAAGRFKEIEHNTIKDAIDTSLDFVYQRTPKGDDVFAKAGRTLLTAHRELPFLVSSVMPFPRFVINQLDFVAQHAPAIGMAVAKIQGREALSADVMSKQLTGMAGLVLAYRMRAAAGPETEWYEYTADNGKTIDLRPIAGPFNAFLLGADLLYRSNAFGLEEKEEELKQWSNSAKDAFQALGGPSMRAGTGLYTLDRMLEDVGSIKFTQTAAKYTGDMINTFTLPVATFRDLFSLGEEADRLVPPSGYVNAWDTFAVQATRSLPSVPFFDTSLAEGISDVLGSGEVDVTEGRADILTGEDLRNIDPLERQIFGASKRAPKNELQKALVRLGMSPYEVYRPADYPVEDRMLRQAAGADVARKLNTFVQSDEFKKMGPKLQKIAIADRAKAVISEYRDAVGERIDQEEVKKTETGESTPRDQFRFEALPKRMRDALREAYKEQYGEDLDETGGYAQALELQAPVKQRARGYSKGGAVTDEQLQEDMTNPFYMDDGDFTVDEEAVEDLEAAGEMALGFLPIVGDAIDAKDFYNAVKDEDYIGAAISAVGFVPIVGNAMKSGLKATRELYEAADPLIKNRSLKAFVDEEGRVPDLSDEADIAILTDKAAKQEKVVAGISSRDKGRETPLFHGSMEGGIDLSKSEPHKELEFDDSLSTSRDPLYAAQVFGGGDLENVEVLIPKRGREGTVDMSSEEYDTIGRIRRGEDVRIPKGNVESRLPIQLPKSFHVEAETVIRDIAGDTDLSKLKDNPELYEKVKKGMEELNGKTLDDGTYIPGVNDLINGGLYEATQIMDASSAVEAYNTLAKGLKKAQGLGAYTSGAGARGMYDKIINEFASVPGEMDEDTLDALLNMRDFLVDSSGKLTQKGEKVDELIEIIEDYRSRGPVVTAEDAAGQGKEFKEAFMDVTNKMNRGGLMARRT